MVCYVLGFMAVDVATWNEAERLVELVYVCCLHWLVRTCVQVYNMCFFGLHRQITVAEATDTVSFCACKNDS